MSSCLPFFAEGRVVEGFGRGSKELGIPTANFPVEVVDSLPESIEGGVYFGWANVDNGEVYKMVMSIGWNPYYNNTKKSMETHIINKFKEDFYGASLKVIIMGFIRKMEDYSSLEALIEAIESDIQTAKEKLELPENKVFKTNNFFVDTIKQKSV